MLLVLPISKSDAHLTDAMVKAFQTFTPGNNHRLLVVSDPKAQEDASVLLGKLREYFSEAKQEVFSANNSYGWPRSCNYYFQQACHLVTKYAKANQGWLWMEMDSTPIASNWLTLIEQEYYRDSETAFQENRQVYRFLGAKERTILSKMGEFHDDGYHMAAVGVYPGDYAACPVMKSITGVDKHFSVHLKWYPLKGFNISPLIQSNRDTLNYRLEGDAIVSDSQANNPWDIHFNAPIGENTVLLHGCKDGSLINVISPARKVSIEILPPKASPAPAPVKYAKFGQPLPFSVDNQPINRPIGVQPQAAPQTVLETTKVEHPQLPKPTTVMKFGQFEASGAGKAHVQFDGVGNPASYSPPVIPAEITSSEVVTPPAIPVQVEPPVAPQSAPVIGEQAQAQVPAAPKRSKKDARKSAWTPERRAKQAEIFKARMAAKNSVPEPVTV